MWNSSLENSFDENIVQMHIIHCLERVFVYLSFFVHNALTKNLINKQDKIKTCLPENMYGEFSTTWFLLRLLTSVFTFTYKRVTFSVIEREINFLLLVIAANISTKKKITFIKVITKI